MTLEKELGEKAKEGAFWGTSGALLQEGLVLVFGMIMGHLVSEAEFGLFNTVSLYTNIGSILLQIGLPVALIQRKQLTEMHMRTAYTAMLGAGLLLVLAITALSPRLSRFYGQPQAAPAFIVASLIFLFNAAYGVPNALLTRSFQFKWLTINSFIAVVISGVVALWIAARGYGLSGLIASAVGFPAVILIPATWLCGWRPRLGFDKTAFRELAGVGVMIMASNLVLYLSQNADQFILGKLLGLTLFGYYARAYGLIILPLQKISTLVEYVAFPAYAQIQDRTELLRAWYLKSSLILAVIAYPIITGLASIAPEFLRLFYGARWVGAVLPMRILAVATLLLTVHMMAGSVLVAIGQARAYLACQILRLALMTTAAVIGSRWGLVGVCWAVGAGNLAYLFVAQSFIGRFLNVGLALVLRNLVPPFVMMALMVAVISACRLALQQGSIEDPRLWLVVSLVAGAGTYIAAIHCLPFHEVREVYFDILEQFKKKWRRGRPSTE